MRDCLRKVHLQKHGVPLPDFEKVETDPCMHPCAAFSKWVVGSGVRSMRHCHVAQTYPLALESDGRAVSLQRNAQEADLHSIGERFGYPMMLKSRSWLALQSKCLMSAGRVLLRQGLRIVETWFGFSQLSLLAVAFAGYGAYDGKGNAVVPNALLTYKLYDC